MTTTEPFTLSDFVSQHETLPAILKPWKHGEHVFATDGRIMVRTSAALFPEVAPNDAPKETADTLQNRTEELFADLPPDDHWLAPTDEMREVKPVKCDKCVDGIKQCESCSHHGECDYCDGTGFSVPHTAIKVGNAYMNRLYVEKLCRLPGVMLHLPPDRKELDAVRFRFDHGIGVLMPMKNHHMTEPTERDEREFIEYKARYCEAKRTMKPIPPDANPNAVVVAMRRLQRLERVRHCGHESYTKLFEYLQYQTSDGGWHNIPEVFHDATEDGP